MRTRWLQTVWPALLPALLLALAAAILLHLPVARPALAGGLLIAALGVAWRPLWLWLIVPAALPLLDLAPWTGRLFLDEYDALLALLIAVAWQRTPAAPVPPIDTRLRLLLLAVAASLLLSSARALLPWPGLDANAFANLTSPFNALRVGRGAVWGWLLWQLARRQQAAGGDVGAALGCGLALGLLGTVAFIVAERMAFSHWLDLADGYRVAGPFAAMNTGGAYVECFLVTALPFVLARLWPPVPAWRLAAAGTLLLGALYAVMVTFSRSGYAALLISLGLSVALTLRSRGQRRARITVALVLALTTAGIALPVLLGSFAQRRLAVVDRDLVTREQHWQHSLSLIDHDLPTLALGMGLGRFAAVDLLRSAPEQRSASYRLMGDEGDEAGEAAEQGADGQRYLQLGTGKAIYIDQMVVVRPGQRYQLQLRVRASAPDAALGIALCEKWLVTSATCVHASIGPGLSPQQWTDLSQALPSGAIGSHPVRPVVLSFHATGPAMIDLASIQLSDTDGRPLLRNSRFAQGMNHWYFSSDHHLAWHTKSMPLALLFDQGLLGLASLGALLGLALLRAGRSAWGGATAAVPWLAALAGFTTIGMVDSLIDTPRFLMLWLLLCLVAASPGQMRPAQRLK